MKKKVWDHALGKLFPGAKKILLKMKLTLFIILFSFFGAMATDLYSQTTKLSLDLKNSTVKDVLGAIETQSEFFFLYSEKIIDVNREVNIEVSGSTVDKILDKIFAGTNVSYTVKGRQIVLTTPEANNFFGDSSTQQQKTISGKVTDSSGGPLPGVSIVVKGTTTGVITDTDGNYTLSKISENATLQFSFVGMKTQEIKVGSQSEINVTLEEENIRLDEVVAIGYGTTTKRKMVGAVSSVDTKKIEQLPFPDVSQALQGQVAGLIVQNSGGSPGAVPSISIRGGGKPLFVIDGVMIDEGDDISFSTLNMDDIESISFLKDASSTAVYGSRAGNGIVLVKTKRGKEGALKLNYSFNQQLSQPTVLPEHNNSYEFSLIQNQAAKYDGIAPYYSEEQLDIIKNHKDLNAYPDNNWHDLLLKNYAPSQRHNLSVSGGNKRTDYFVSLGYFDQGGILKSNTVDLTRFNIRSNVTTKFDKIGLEVGVNVNASLQNQTEPGAGETTIFQAVEHCRSNYRALNTDGTIAGGVFNPLAESNKEAGYNKQRQKFINTQVLANWSVPNIKGWTIGIMGNYRDDDNYSKLWSLLAPQYNDDGSIYPVPKPSLSVSSGYGTKLDFEANTSYSGTFGKHGIDATLVYTRSKGASEVATASRRDYMSSAVDQLFAGPSDGKDNGGNGFNFASEGYVGRFKYDYASKYILEFSCRYDGNDNFAPSQRWGFFPAISGAWIASDEKFMKTLNDKNIINFLKLRLSTGKTGISDDAIRLGYLPVYNLVPNAYNIGNGLVAGFSEGPLVDANSLTWYTRNSLNYGFNFSSLKNKLEGSFDYFHYRTSGYLMSPTNRYTTTLGKDLPQIKSNSVQRRAGYELTLRYKGKIDKLSYEIGVNYSRFNQLWEQLDTEDSLTLKNPYTRQTHETDYWGNVYLSDGLYQGEDDILNTPRRLASTQTQGGDIRYVDTNGDGKIDDQDKRRLGLPTFPHANYGIDFSLNYKSWSMGALIQGTGDRYIALGNEYTIGEGKEQLLKIQQNYWSPENPNAEFPRVTHTSGVNGGNNKEASDFWVRNAKYIRLKSLRVTYDLKSSVLKNQSFISSCKVILSGTNLLTISQVMDYFDPETDSYTNSGYPVQKVYSIGLNVEL